MSGSIPGFTSSATLYGVRFTGAGVLVCTTDNAADWTVNRTLAGRYDINFGGTNFPDALSFLPIANAASSIAKLSAYVTTTSPNLTSIAVVDDAGVFTDPAFGTLLIVPATLI